MSDSARSAAQGIPVTVPEELDALPPGAMLVELLDGVCIEGVSGHDTVRVLTAAYRQVCRDRALFLLALLETGLRKRGSASTVERVTEPDEFACEEARAALVWSRSRADSHFTFADAVFRQLPMLGEAMLAGDVDEPRAKAFVEWTTGLSDEQASRVCDQLLPEAPSMTVGELIDRIKQLCIALDPQWAERRYRQAVKSRRVAGFRNPDGTANLAGYNQPVDRVAAAAGRIDALARTCKRTGDARPIDHIRSDLYLGMTDGAFTGMTDDQIIDHVLTHPYTPPPPGPDQAELNLNGHHDHHRDTGTERTDDVPSDDDPSDDDTDGDGLGGSHGDGSGPGDSSGPGGDGGPDDHPGHSTDGDSDSDSTNSDSTGGDDAGGDSDGDGGSNGGGSRGGRGMAAGRSWSVPELRIRLSTLLGRDEFPAEIPGWDFIPAWLARHLLTGMHTAAWRYVLCDSNGHAIDSGPLRNRPALPAGPTTRPGHGGIVEIAYTATDLTTITETITRGTTNPDAGNAVVPDTSTPTAAAPSAVVQRWAPVITELRTRRRSDRADSAHDDPTRRVAGTRLRRWIQTRDRTCRHPACRAPATTTDQDHRHRHAAGGPTTEHNLDSACRHDHRLTDEADWTVTPHGPHTVAWTSPLGHHYTSTTPQVMP